MSGSFLKQLREAAMRLPLDDPRRFTLGGYADALQGDIAQLGRFASAETLARMNGIWARAEGLLVEVHNSPIGGGSGAMPVPQERKAA